MASEIQRSVEARVVTVKVTRPGSVVDAVEEAINFAKKSVAPEHGQKTAWLVAHEFGEEDNTFIVTVAVEK